jgi:hypothetical protein
VVISDAFGFYHDKGANKAEDKCESYRSLEIGIQVQVSKLMRV